jgi:hypothetical protein
MTDLAPSAIKSTAGPGKTGVSQILGRTPVKLEEIQRNGTSGPRIDCFY